MDTLSWSTKERTNLILPDIEKEVYCFISEQFQELGLTILFIIKTKVNLFS